MATEKEKHCDSCWITTLENFDGSVSPISEPFCCNDTCPCHKPTENEGEGVEEWREKFDEIFRNTRAFSTVIPSGGVMCPDSEQLKAFISQVALKERQAGYEKGIQEEAHKCHEHSEASYKQGRADTVAEVREKIHIALDRLEFVPIRHAECEQGKAEPCEDCIGRMNLNAGLLRGKNEIRDLLSLLSKSN